MPHTGAIFDMDGILFDTEKIYQKHWMELGEELHAGLPDNFGNIVSGSSGIYMDNIVKEYFHTENPAPIITECLDRVHRDLNSEEGVELKPGVREFLEFLKDRGLKTAVASSSPSSFIRHNLKSGGIEELFDAVVSGMDFTKGKPAPDIFLTASEKIGCRPEECYVFEDSLNGVLASHRAGCTTIMIPDLQPPKTGSEAFYDACCPSFFHVMKLMG